ncbi:hypothetical protein H5410_037032 [Solanum commersonii]|uniref:Uncharacterized protein n=1 Tax=Solanum commersonii TaxID=4109 RepID=A0A9J5Y8C6_SOLCO|nr:hypothetical protein H5410_037032 [Solanum commersonii]
MDLLEELRVCYIGAFILESCNGSGDNGLIDGTDNTKTGFIEQERYFDRNRLQSRNMMHFRDRDSPHPLLEIVGDDQQNPNAKVLLLEVQPPAVGVFSLVSGNMMNLFSLKNGQKWIPKAL